MTREKVLLCIIIYKTENEVSDFLCYLSRSTEHIICHYRTDCLRFGVIYYLFTVCSYEKECFVVKRLRDENPLENDKTRVQ